MSRAYNMNYTIIHIYLISINKNDFQLQRHHLQSKQVDATCSGESPKVHYALWISQVPAATASSARLQLLQAWIAIAVDGTMRPELWLLNLHFFNICRHHPTLKFKPHATDDER